MNNRKEPFLVRIFYYPIVFIQLILMLIGWYSLLPYCETAFSCSIDDSLWLLAGLFITLLSICWPFYLKLTDAGNNRIWQTYNNSYKTHTAILAADLIDKFAAGEITISQARTRWPSNPGNLLLDKAWHDLENCTDNEVKGGSDLSSPSLQCERLHAIANSLREGNTNLCDDDCTDRL